MFAAQATAGVWGDNYYINNSTGDNTNTYVSPNVTINYGTEEDPIVPYDSTTGTYVLDSTNANSTFVNLRRGDAASTTITSFTIGNSMTISTWNGGFTGLTIQALKGNGSSVFTNESNNTVSVNTVTGVDSITNAGTLTLGTAAVAESGTVGEEGYVAPVAASTTTLTTTLTNSGTLTLLGNFTFDVSDITGYTLTDSSAMNAPEAGTNGFESGSATYALVNNNGGTVDATGATVTTTAGDTISTTEGTMTITKTGTGTKYYIQNGSSVALSDIQGEGTVTDVVVNSGTLELDATGVGLNKITGAGNVNVTTATTLTGSLASAATGTLTVTNTTLSVGSGQGETNSLSSFGTVNLVGGTISYNNSKDTLNNVTVASGSTGTINSYDMGTGTFTLAGTTNIAGELTIQNLYNAQFTIETLTGAGTLSIKGTNGGSSSSEAATYTLGDTSTFTGTINIGNSKATVSQTFDTIEAMEADLTYTVTGGTVVKTCTAGISGDTDLGDASGTISGAISGGTITGGTGDVTLSGAISDATINGNNNVTVASSTISNTTLKDVALGGSGRKTLSGTVNLDGVTNDIASGTYALLASTAVNLNITGTTYLDTTSEAGTNANSLIGMGSASTITVKEGALLTTGAIMNTTRDVTAANTQNNVNVVVEKDAMLQVGNSNTTVMTSLNNAGTTEIAGTAIIGTLTNSGDLTMKNEAATMNSVTLNGGTITLGTEESHDNDLTVSTLKLDATSTINANLVLSDGAKVTLAEGATVTMGCDIKLSGTASITLPTLVTESDGTWTTIATDVEDVLDSNGNSITLSGSSWTKSEGAEKWSTAVSVVDNGDNTYTYTTGATGGSLVLVYDQTAKTLMVTPEPATATLSLLALTGLAARRRRRA